MSEELQNTHWAGCWLEHVECYDMLTLEQAVYDVAMMVEEGIKECDEKNPDWATAAYRAARKFNITFVHFIWLVMAKLKEWGRDEAAG